MTINFMAILQDDTSRVIRATCFRAARKIADCYYPTRKGLYEIDRYGRLIGYGGDIDEE